MDIVVQQGPEVATIRVRGRFEFSGYRDFRDALDRAFGAPGKELVIDLSATDYIDSSALGMLLIALDRAQAAKRRITLSGSRGPVREVLEIANLHKRFSMV